MLTRRIALVAIAAVVVATATAGVFAAPPPQTVWSTTVERTEVRPGEVALVKLRAQIADLRERKII